MFPLCRIANILILAISSKLVDLFFYQLVKTMAKKSIYKFPKTVLFRLCQKRFSKSVTSVNSDVPKARLTFFCPETYGYTCNDVYVYVSVCHAFLKSYLLPHFWGDTFETFLGDTLGDPSKKYFLTFFI